MLPTLGIAHPSGYPLYARRQPAVHRPAAAPRTPQPGPTCFPRCSPQPRSACWTCVAYGGGQPGRCRRDHGGVRYLSDLVVAGDHRGGLRCTGCWPSRLCTCCSAGRRRQSEAAGLPRTVPTGCWRWPHWRPGWAGAPPHDRPALPRRRSCSSSGSPTGAAAPATTLAAALALLLAPLLLYVYLLIRGQVVWPSLDGTYQPDPPRLHWIGCLRAYGVFLTGNPFGVAQAWGTTLPCFCGKMGALTALAAVAGLVTGWRYSLRRSVFLLLALAGQTLFAVNYKVQDIEVFLLPAFMLMAVWAAWGLAPLFDSFAQRRGQRPAAAPAAAGPPVVDLPVAAARGIRAALRAGPRQCGGRYGIGATSGPCMTWARTCWTARSRMA